MYFPNAVQRRVLHSALDLVDCESISVRILLGLSKSTKLAGQHTNIRVVYIDAMRKMYFVSIQTLLYKIGHGSQFYEIVAFYKPHTIVFGKPHTDFDFIEYICEFFNDLHTSSGLMAFQVSPKIGRAHVSTAF